MIYRIKLVFLCFIYAALVILAGCGSLRQYFGNGNYFAEKEILSDDLIPYAQELTDIRLDDCIKNAGGEIDKSLWEEYAYICLTLNSDGIDTVTQRLSELGMEPFTGEEIQIYPFNGNKIAKELKSRNIISQYTLFSNGKGGAKTRSVELYLTEDTNGNKYLYLFG